MSERRHVLAPGCMPRGLCREEAAQYVGVSPAKFDQMVKDRRMPVAKSIDGRRVWDVRALDRAFDSLPDQNEATNNPWHG